MTMEWKQNLITQVENLEESLTSRINQVDGRISVLKEEDLH